MKGANIYKKVFAALFLLILYTLSAYIIRDTASDIAEEAERYARTAALEHPSGPFWDLEDTVVYSNGLRRRLRELYSGIHTALGKREERSFLYLKDQDGFLYGGGFPIHDNGIMDYAKRLRRLGELTSRDRGCFLVIGAPDRQTYGRSPDFGGYPVDWRPSRDMDELMLCLFSNGVDTLDLRYSRMSAIVREELFYRTELYWTTGAAFEAFCVIVEELNGRYYLDLDSNGFFRDIKNYNVTVYPDAMLGSIGRSAGINFSGTEDFSLIVPAYGTSFKYESDYPARTVKTGGFEDALLEHDYLASKDPRENNPYNVYLGGDRGYRRIINNNLPEGARILLIGDAFFTPVCAFLSNVCAEVTVLYPLASEVDVEGLLSENHYNCVLVAYQPGSLSFLSTDGVITMIRNIRRDILGILR